MTEGITITISGADKVGKSRIMHSLSDQLKLAGFQDVRLDDKACDYGLPDAPPAIVVTAVRPGLHDSAQLERPIYPMGFEINTAALSVHQQNVDAGWWHDPRSGIRLDRNVGELLMLICSELAEGADGIDIPDDKLPHRNMLEVELADTKIRILDVAGGHGLDIGGAFDDLVALDYGRICARKDVHGSLMQIVCEVAGAMEGHRKDARDKTLGGRSAFEARLAAALVLIHYLSDRLGLDVDGAVKEKRAFNRTRPDHQREARLAAGGKRY